MLTQEQYYSLCIKHYYHLKFTEIIQNQNTTAFIAFPLLILENTGQVFHNKAKFIHSIVAFIIQNMYQKDGQTQQDTISIKDTGRIINFTVNQDTNVFVMQASQLYIRILLFFLAEIWQINSSYQINHKHYTIHQIIKRKIQTLCRLLQSYLLLSNLTSFSDLLIGWMQQIQIVLQTLLKDSSHFVGVYQKIYHIFKGLMLQKLEKWFQKKQEEIKKCWEIQNKQMKQNLKFNKQILPEQKSSKIVIKKEEKKVKIQRIVNKEVCNDDGKERNVNKSQESVIQHSPPSSSMQNRLSLYKSQQQNRKSMSRTLYHGKKYRFKTNAKKYMNQDSDQENCITYDEDDGLPQKI